MKYHHVLQYSEEDCGAACLAAIAKHYGRNFSLNHIREVVGTGQLGTTLLGLRRGTEAMGFNARSGQASKELLQQLDKVPLPAIIHWQGYHWVVFYGKKGRKYVIADPAVGIRYLSLEELSEGWANGIMLLLKPNAERFFAQTDDQSQVRGFLRFLKRVAPYRSWIIQATCYALIVGLLALAAPFLIQILTDEVLVRGDISLLAAVAIAVMVMKFIETILQTVQENLVAHVSERLELSLVLDFGRQILHLPLTYYETRRSGEIVSRLEDIQTIKELISELVVSLPSQVFIALFSLGLMLFYSAKLTLIAIAIGVMMTLSTFFFLPTLQQKIRQLLVLDAENQGVLVESFKGALALKTTSAEPQFWDELQNRFGRLANHSLTTIRISIFNRRFSDLISDLGSISLLWLGSLLVIGTKMSIGQLLAFYTLSNNFWSLINFSIEFVDDVARAKTATQRFTEVIDATPETPNHDKKPFVTIPDHADIICHQVHFCYPGRVELLEDFSLTIPGGRVIALIVTSGCGKTSLAKIIAGLYPLQSGNIRLGDYNLSDLSLASLRRQVILIPQEAHFWSRSIVENFRLGTPHLPFESIVQACRISGADEFISKLPDKYQTVLGEFGSNLSGGQKQRLAISRALVTNPPILVLDESTSGLDPISEAQVLSNLLSYRQGKTTILISHRPSVVQLADWIMMLEDGKLSIEGTPEDLRHQAGKHLTFLPSLQALGVR
ncbi:MAG: peptidase domain-containing ABC transporter [Prochloraceae cyanobacterium]